MMVCKKSKKFLALVIIGVTTFVTSISSAHAATVLVTPGRADADDADVSSDDTVVSNFEANRSYECTIRQRRISSASEFVTFSLEGTDPNGDAIAYTATGNITPVVASPTGVSSLRSRISIIADITGTYTLGVSAPSPTIATVRCVETTLFGSYNTFYAGTPVVELSNSTDKTIEAFVTIIDYGDNILVSRKKVTIRGNQRVDTVFSSIPAETVGSIFVIYEGPFGAISGFVSEYDFSSSSISLRRERPLATRPALP